jgi:hypothetical protein
MSRAPRSAPPGRRRVRFTLHPLPFCRAERQVRVEADPRAGGAVGGPECPILSPDFGGGEARRPRPGVRGFSGNREGRFVDAALREPHSAQRSLRAIHALVLVDARGIEKAASSTLGYGNLTQLSEVPERSTAMRQAGGAYESCASLHSPRPQKGSVSARRIRCRFAARNARCVLDAGLAARLAARRNPAHAAPRERVEGLRTSRQAGACGAGSSGGSSRLRRAKWCQ